MRLETWTAIEAEIDRIIRESVEEPFDQGTITNIRELVRFARANCPVPEIGKGYWSTIRFTWKTPPIEIEVYDDRFELYRFHDGRTDIREVRHAPGSPLPPELAANLPRRDPN